MFTFAQNLTNEKNDDVAYLKQQCGWGVISTQMPTHPFDMSMSSLDLWYYITKQAKDKDDLIDIMIK